MRSCQKDAAGATRKGVHQASQAPFMYERCPSEGDAADGVVTEKPTLWERGWRQGECF